MSLLQDGAALLGALSAAGGRVAMAMLVWVGLMLVLPLVTMVFLRKWAAPAPKEKRSQARPASHPSPTAHNPPTNPAPPSTRTV